MHAHIHTHTYKGWHTCINTHTPPRPLSGSAVELGRGGGPLTDDEDDFGPRSGGVKHLVLLDELGRLRQVRVALDGELADGREAVVPPVGEVGTVGQHCGWHGGWGGEGGGQTDIST